MEPLKMAGLNSQPPPSTERASDGSTSARTDSSVPVHTEGNAA